MTANNWVVPSQTARQPQVEPWTVGTIAVSRLYLSCNGPALTLHIPPQSLCVLLQIVGRSTLDQPGHTCRLLAGQWTALDTMQLHIQAHSIDTQILMLQIPRWCLTGDMGEASTAPESWLRAYNNRALSRTLRVFAATPHRFNAVTAEQVSTLLCRVVEHSLREQIYSDRRAHRAAFSAYASRLSRVYVYIKRHMDRPTLEIEEIANEAACTVRYLQKMFAPGGESVREYILHGRLELVHRDLLSSRLANRPVTEIALAHGFNNASHFTRKYREHFGITPSAMRFIHQSLRLQSPERPIARSVVTTQSE